MNNINRRNFIKLAMATAFCQVMPKIYLPIVNSNPETRFAIIADPQYTKNRIEQIFPLLAQLQIDFVIVAGDVIGYGSSGVTDSLSVQWAYTIEKLNSLGKLWYAVPGNHDLGYFWNKPTQTAANSECITAWNTYVGSRQFVKDTDNMRIVGVDCYDWSAGNRDWITAQLATEKRKVVVQHFPITGVVPKYLASWDWLDWWAEEKITFYQNLGIDLFVSGHRHSLSVSKVGTMTHLCCPAVCGACEPVDPTPNGNYPSVPVIGWVEITSNYAIDVFREDGILLSSFNF